MQHSAKLSTNRIIAYGFIIVGVLLALSIISNIIQGVNNYRLQNEQRTVITPMGFYAPFAVSKNSADASYLQQVALSFVDTRLNVSPETVDGKHELLLKFVRPGAQPDMKVKLAQEAIRIKDNEVNSVFYQEKMKVYPKGGRVDLWGTLKTWIGDSNKPINEIKHYVLVLDYSDGFTWLDKFGETKDDK